MHDRIAYEILQKEYGLKTGDRVKVLRKPVDGEMGWYADDNTKMDSYVNKESMIEDMDDYYGYLLKIPGECCCYFPFFVLEKVEEVIKHGDYGLVDEYMRLFVKHILEKELRCRKCIWRT